MRGLGNFTAKEWLRALPLQHAFKQVRNDALLAIYKRIRPQALQSFLDETQHLKGKNIALIIAFEQPWALAWQLRMIKQNLADTTALVCDNSQRMAARAEVKRVCADNGVSYLALPKNPTHHVNRSHGMALTWAFYNIVQEIQPSLFAFLDHDLIPIERVSLEERLGGKPFFGDAKISDGGWSLWAGYCMYDFAAVTDLPLNFLYDFSRELDTGGRNYRCLYRHYDWRELRLAASEFITTKDPLTGESRRIEMIDQSWFHMGGISYNDGFPGRFKFFEYLAQGLDEGKSWSVLVNGE